VKALNLERGDSIAQMLTFDAGEEPDVLVVTSLGYGKRSNTSQYRQLGARNSKGVMTIGSLKADRNGLIVGARAVQDDDTLIILSTKGKMIQIPISSIRSTNRVATGVRVVTLDNGDSVGSIATVTGGANEITEEQSVVLTAA
jgi:DNA gyrase subunit A